MLKCNPSFSLSKLPTRDFDKENNVGSSNNNAAQSSSVVTYSKTFFTRNCIHVARLSKQLRVSSKYNAKDFSKLYGEMLTEIVDGLKIEFAEMAEAKANPETEKPELWNI